jgi:hypothetical protein
MGRKGEKRKNKETLKRGWNEEEKSPRLSILKGSIKGEKKKIL